MTLWQQAQAMVARIVQRFQPECVFVFGSLARGEAGPDSDIDLLVVMPFEGSRHELTVALLSAVADFAAPKDIAVLTPAEFEATKDRVGTLAYPVVREGKLLHAA